MFLLQLNAATPRAAEIPEICLTGYPELTTLSAVERPYTLNAAIDDPQPVVHPALQRWMHDYRWQNGYSLWQQSRQCRDGLIEGKACTIDNAILPNEEKCGGAQDGYEFLVMHRYLLQTIKGLSPQLEKPFTTWKRFPGVEHYPEEIQHQVHPWPDAVRRAARVADTLTKAKAEEIAQRWPTEGDFGRWLQCGADHSLGINALHGALLTNAIDIPAEISGAQPHLLNLYLFWQAHSWIDLAWEKYRRAMGKMPDEPQLQAALLQQCRVFQFWTNQIHPTGEPEEIRVESLYQNGHFSHRYSGRLAKVMGQVEEIRTDENSRVYLRIDPRLHGVNELWITTNTPLNIERVKLGDRFYFVGTVVTLDQLNSTGAADFIQSPAMMLAVAIQAVK